MKLPIMTFQQPIGEFALTVMSIDDILKISYINRREFDTVILDSKGGPQREPSTKRINEIAAYSETPDATFPTPILLALPEDTYSITNGFITLNDNENIASIVDGQHRILGLEKSKYRAEYVLPVVFILDATEEQKALIFAIINGKQTRVSASMIYDLFAVVEGRNPYKTAHEIARSLNANPESPFYRRLKMLGNKSKGSFETLSQGTFVTQLLRHISSDPSEDFNNARQNKPMVSRPECVFNGYFLDDKDEVIVRILLNLFSAIKETFPNEWEDTSNFILTKTTGYTGVMKALPDIIRLGKSKNTMSREFFVSVFKRLRSIFLDKGLRFISDDFPPNNAGESKLRDFIRLACQE
jgi:DGQHR domain-containing protein